MKPIPTIGMVRRLYRPGRYLSWQESVVMQMERKPSALGEWLTSLSARRHRNITVVALANKMARIAWAILSKGTHYSPAAAVAA